MTPNDLPATIRPTYERCMRLVRIAGVLVPERRRDEWTREWMGELWYRASLLDRDDDSRAHAARRLYARTLGAFPHAVWTFTDELRLDPMLQDLKYALRGIARRPAFAALVIATLTIGIGANTAMFSIVHGVLVKPLPYERPDELVYMYGAFSRGSQASVSPPDYLDYRERNSVFSSLAARTVFGTSVITGSGEPERVRSAIASANFFSTLGIAPYRGRAFLPEEENGDHAVAILSFGLWQRRYAGDARIIGATVPIDGRAHTVVGVMPPVLDRTMDIQVWRPIAFNTSRTSVRRFHFLRLVGRLKPGVTLAQAQRHMDVVAGSLAAQYPENEGWHLALSPYRDVVIGDVRPVLLILLGAVALVLLIACGNVASLLLARASARSGEMAVRTALGAGRGRLVRQLLTESAALGIASGIAGLALGHYLLVAVRAVGTGMVPRLAEIEIDGTVLIFTVLISLATSLTFGAAPALHAIRSDLASVMKSLGKTSATRRGVSTRDTLVVAQVALSCVLLIAAGLLVRSLWQLQRVETGFDPSRLVAAEVSLPETRYRTRDAVAQFWNQFLDRVRAIPGVESASATSLFPLRGGGDTYFYVEGRPPETDADKMNATISTVTDDYFSTMRIPLVAGRAFDASDRRDGPGVLIVSNALATRLFPGASALGKRLVVDFGKPFTGEIIGVAGDVRVYGQVNDAPDLLYFTMRQPNAGWGLSVGNLAARVRGDPASLAPQLRAVVRELDADVPLSSVQSVESILSDSVSGQRLRTQLLVGFAVVALLLAVIGLYGVLAYSVSQRSREMGIRMALGARRWALLGLVMRQGMVLVVIGVVLGIAASLGVTRLLRAQLFGVGPTDPAVFAIMATALIIAGLAACVVPARRATRADPMLALRTE